MDNTLSKFFVNENKVIAANTTVDVDYFAYKKKEYPKKEKVRMIFVGRIEKHKGIYDILSVMEQLRAEPCYIELYGSGSCVEDLKNKIEEKKLDSKVILKGRKTR